MGDTGSEDRSRAKQRTSLADQRTDLADQRTEWAQRRTVLAREWTFSAWVRTGLSAVAAGLGIPRLLQQFRPAWVPRALGTAFVLVGGIVFGICPGRKSHPSGRMAITSARARVAGCF
jgi:putative membrane protein